MTMMLTAVKKFDDGDQEEEDRSGGYERRRMG